MYCVDKKEEEKSRIPEEKLELSVCYALSSILDRQISLPCRGLNGNRELRKISLSVWYTMLARRSGGALKGKDFLCHLTRRWQMSACLWCGAW